MPAGEIILVSYGDENIVLSENPQISFFKIIYRRYTNFSIETIQTNFLYEAKFGKKYTVEIGKVGDLLNKMWLVIELPQIPKIYNYNNNVDKKIKFKWTRKLAYAIIDYVEIEIGNQIISRQWGEWMNVLEELNWNNFNGSLDQYIGNIPELTTYKFLAENFNSSTLYIPLWFWFCNNSGTSLPLLCLEYNSVRFNVQLNDFQNCGIFSPSNYILVQSYYGNGILGEPLVQYSSQGVAWGEFDSIDIGSNDLTTMNVNNYILYYRKISDNTFLSSTELIITLTDLLNNNSNSLQNYIIYGLYSGSIYIPIPSNPDNPQTINIEQTYSFEIPNNFTFKNMYLLCNYIYLDRDERKKFYLTKHEYIIEQVYFTNPKYLGNLNNKIYFESINPCKYIIFMGQVKYFLNYNVNQNFNYNLHFFDTSLVNNKYIEKMVNYINKPVIKAAYIGLNSNSATISLEMSFYSLLTPFLDYPMGKNESGFGILSFSLYPETLQPSGSCNMSCFNSFEINTNFYPIDINYNQYVFKGYSINYNFLKIANGVAATIFNTIF